MSTPTTTAVLPDWLEQARASHRCHPLGSLGLIDAQAVLRGVGAISTGDVISIGRPLGGSVTPDVSVNTWTSTTGIYTSAYDRVQVECHGTLVTHLDALNHFGLFNTFYGAVPAAVGSGVDVAALAHRPVVTRAVLLDLVEQVEGEHVQIGQPIGAEELQRALDRAGTEVLPGDALLVYMGRERFEAAGGRVAPVAESPHGRPGIGDDGARWLAGQPVGVLAWDFLDAHPHREIGFPVHALSWAVGLVLVDNCVMGHLSNVMANSPQRTGLFVASPLAVAGGTGSAVNPVVVL